MLSTCNSVCLGGLTLTQTTQCDLYNRSEIPVRLLIATCDTAFPIGLYTDSAHAAAVAALISAGVVSATFELSDFQWADPQTTKKNFLSKRVPPKTIITGRQLTAKDYNATDKDVNDAASPYEDRLFYKNIIQNKACKVRGYITDNGKIYLFLDSNSEFMGYDISYWIGYDQEVEGKLIEFKNYMIDFVGDPLRQITTPYLDIIAAGAQSSLGWLYQAN
jgi:hypothetical protein